MPELKPAGWKLPHKYIKTIRNRVGRTRSKCVGLKRKAFPCGRTTLPPGLAEQHRVSPALRFSPGAQKGDAYSSAGVRAHIKKLEILGTRVNQG